MISAYNALLQSIDDFRFSPPISFSVNFLLRSAKLQIVHTFFYFFPFFFQKKNQDMMSSSTANFPSFFRIVTSRSTHVDQGFSTNQKIQPKKLTNQKTAGTKYRSPHNQVCGKLRSSGPFHMLVYTSIAHWYN